MSPMRVEDEFVVGSRRAVEALALAVDELAAIVPEEAQLARAVNRGHFRPDEEAALLSWFARFLTIRTGLWEVLGDVSRPVGGSVRRVLDLAGWRFFVLVAVFLFSHGLLSSFCLGIQSWRHALTQLPPVLRPSQTANRQRLIS